MKNLVLEERNIVHIKDKAYMLLQQANELERLYDSNAQLNYCNFQSLILCIKENLSEFLEYMNSF